MNDCLNVKPGNRSCEACRGEMKELYCYCRNPALGPNTMEPKQPGYEPIAPAPEGLPDWTQGGIRHYTLRSKDRPDFAEGLSVYGTKVRKTEALCAGTQWTKEQLASTAGPNPRERGEIEPLLDGVSSDIAKLGVGIRGLAEHLNPILGPDAPIDVGNPMPAMSVVGGALADFSFQIRKLTAEVEAIRHRSQV